MFRFDEEVEPGDHILDITFSGILNDKLRGFYRSTFVDGEGVQHVIATTQFESIDARRAFPCWDEPDRKAVFAITLDVPAGLTAVSNSPVVHEEDLPDGRHRFSFGDTIAMSTYIVAFVVGNLEVTGPVDVDGIPLSVVHVPGKAHMTGFALECGAHALRFFVDWFGIPYPGQKLDLIAIPDFAAGAMENLGAVTFREAEVLIDPDDAAQPELERIAEVIEHEIAHMWFGDLVTMKWWNGIWLNEAFATFMSLLCLDDFRPEWKAWVSYAGMRAAAMQIDSLSTTRPIEYPVIAPEDAEGMFDLLTYEKGAGVLRMIERFLGGDRFRDGVRAYLEAHLLSNTETTDLWDAIEVVAGDQPIRAIMDSWIFQGGYPLVHAAAGESGDLYLSEEPFSLLQSARDDDPVPADESAWPRGPFAPEETSIGEDWLVPVIVGLREGGAPTSFGDLPEESQGTRRVLLTSEGAELRLSEADETPLGALTVVNVGGHGFYRVRYDSDLFSDLVGNLDRLERLERFALVSDTWACAVAGVTELSDFLALTANLGTETDASVWGVVVSAINRLDHAVADHHRVAPPVVGTVAPVAAAATCRLGTTRRRGRVDTGAAREPHRDPRRHCRRHLGACSLRRVVRRHQDGATPRCRHRPRRAAGGCPSRRQGRVRPHPRPLPAGALAAGGTAEPRLPDAVSRCEPRRRAAQHVPRRDPHPGCPLSHAEEPSQSSCPLAGLGFRPGALRGDGGQIPEGLDTRHAARHQCSRRCRREWRLASCRQRAGVRRRPSDGRGAAPDRPADRAARREHRLHPARAASDGRPAAARLNRLSYRPGKAEA